MKFDRECIVRYIDVDVTTKQGIFVSQTPFRSSLILCKMSKKEQEKRTRRRGHEILKSWLWVWCITRLPIKGWQNKSITSSCTLFRLRLISFYVVIHLVLSKSKESLHLPFHVLYFAITSCCLENDSSSFSSSSELLNGMDLIFSLISFSFVLMMIVFSSRFLDMSLDGKRRWSSSFLTDYDEGLLQSLRFQKRIPLSM